MHAKARIALASLPLLIGVLGVGSARANDIRYRDPIFSVATPTTHVYGQATNNLNQPQNLELDLYVPAGDTATSRPAIVWAHGGGFTGGSRTEAALVALAQDFAMRGYVTASISYRVRPPDTPGSPTTQDLIVDSLAGSLPAAMHDAQHDMQTAVRWFRANAATLGVDPTKIVVGGISAGASMALETAFNPEDDGTTEPDDSRVQAAIPVSGGSDVRRIELDAAPPIAMFHGTNDTTAPYPFAVMTCAGAIALLNECELTTYPGDDHNLADRRAETVATAADFLCRRVLGGCPTHYY